MIFTKYNPYYNPKECGLSIIYETDKGEPYEYDKLVVWQSVKDGKLWWDTDHGCFCPVPFEDNDLQLLSKGPSFKEFKVVCKSYCENHTEYLGVISLIEEELNTTG